MYKLGKATVHYGASSYPLNGLDQKFAEISGPEDPKLAYLEAEVGFLTSFPRPFTIHHCEPIEWEGRVLSGERVVALANGYTIGWDKV